MELGPGPQKCLARTTPGVKPYPVAIAAECLISANSGTRRNSLCSNLNVVDLMGAAVNQCQTLHQRKVHT